MQPFLKAGGDDKPVVALFLFGAVGLGAFQPHNIVWLAGVGFELEIKILLEIDAVSADAGLIAGVIDGNPTRTEPPFHKPIAHVLTVMGVVRLPGGSAM